MLSIIYDHKHPYNKLLMPKYIKNTVFVQFTDNSWRCSHFNTETKKLVRENLCIDEGISNKPDAIREQLSDYSSIILLPDTRLLDKSSSNSTIILITKGSKFLFTILYPDFHDSLWEVKEEITATGEINFELSEPEINKALRFVFNKKPITLIIALSNSIFNSQHEKNLHNVLKVAGYKSHTNKFNI